MAKAEPAPTVDVAPVAPRPAFRTVMFNDPNTAMGVAVRLMMDRPAFAHLPFGAWATVTAAQIARGHIRFILDENNRVRGLFGYALVTREKAEAWVNNRATLADADCRDGDCVVFNAWVADTTAVHHALLVAARQMWRGRSIAYFKRFYPDGRIRLVRLALNDHHIAKLDPQRGAGATANTRHSGSDQ